MAWQRYIASINAAGTIVIIPPVPILAPKIVRYLLDTSGANNATMDIQDTNGVSLTGGAISLNAGVTQFNYASEHDAVAYPVFYADTGLGIQLVIVGSNASIKGFVDYFYDGAVT